MLQADNNHSKIQNIQPHSPEPVTPKRVCSFTPLFIPSTNELMAFGWSPNGW